METWSKTSGILVLTLSAMLPAMAQDGGSKTGGREIVLRPENKDNAVTGAISSQLVKKHNLDFPNKAVSQAAQTSDSAASVPTIITGGAVNAASYAVGAPLVPGSITAVFGDFFLATPSQYLSLPLPTGLSGLSIQFGTTKAPLFYASSRQVNLQVPWELAAENTSTLSAVLNGQAGGAQTVQLAPFSPGIFTVNAQGTGQGAVLDSVSNRLVDELNPAVPGTTILEILCTGLGAVTNQPASVLSDKYIA